MGRRDRNDIHIGVSVQVHKGEPESTLHDPSSLVLLFRPSLRGLCRVSLRRVNSFVVALREARVDIGVVLDLVQELGPGLRVIPDSPHRRIKRRASA